MRFGVRGGVKARGRGPGHIRPATNSIVRWPGSGDQICGILGIFTVSIIGFRNYGLKRFMGGVSCNPTYKTVSLIIRQCFTVRRSGILGYKTLSSIPIHSVLLLNMRDTLGNEAK